MKYMITWCEYNHNESTDNLQCAPIMRWHKKAGNVVILYDTKEKAQDAIMEIIREEADYLADYDEAENTAEEYIRTELSGVECIYMINKVEVAE